MAKHLSGRQPRLNVGISSYTESLTVLQVTGKVAIGDTNARNYSLYVVGDTNITGVVSVGVFSGNIVSAAATISLLNSTQSNINNLNAVTGVITSLTGSNLYYPSGIVTTISGTNLRYTGVGTISNLVADNSTILNLSGSTLRYSSGIVTTLSGTNLFYNGIGTIGSFIATNSTILNLSGSTLRYSSGIVTNISGTNLNYSGISTFNASSGPLFVGSATSTGTVGQTFQVVGINSGAFFGGNVGIGSTRPTSKLSVQGDVLISGVVTSLGAFVGVLSGPAQYAYSAGFSTVAVQAGVSTIASVAGFATVSIQAGVSTIAAVAGFATVASIAGYTTYSGTTGFSSFASISGFSTVSSVSGFATVSIQAGVSTIASVAGFATNATRAGVATFSTLAGSAGFSTVASVAGFATVATQAGISTSVIGGVVDVVSLRVSGVSTFTSGPVLIGTGNSTGTRSQQLQVNNGSGAYIAGNLGIGSTNPPSKLSVVGDVSVIGVVTANNFFGPLTGIAASATQLVTPRIFSIVGDFVNASNIAFDGTANVALGATVLPNSIGLGTYTSGDYVRYISGTPNEITVTGGLGEGSTPQISLPSDVTIANNLNVSNDLFVAGNLSVAGTSVVLRAQTLTVTDKDIVLGFTTTGTQNDITANHGGIAIASTEGTPLVPMQAVGINTFPDTYKQLMWVRSGTWAGLTTDAFIFNYGVGIGSTQVPYGVRLAVGSGIQMTDTDINSPYGTFASNLLSANTISGSNQQNSGVTTSLGGFIGNLRGSANYAYAAGFSTFSSTSGFSTVASIAGFSTVSAVAGFATNATRAGVATFASLAGSAGFATVATRAGVSTNVVGGLVDVGNLRSTGIATFNAISAGGTTGLNQYVLTSTGTGVAWQAVTGIGAITGINIAPDATDAVSYIPFVKIAVGTTATEYIDSTLTYNSGTQRLGIGTTNPGSTLDVMGTMYVRDYITSPTFYGNFVGVTSGVTFYSYNAGVSTIASIAGFATVATVAGVSTLATYSYAAGFSTFSSTSGFSTVASIAGFATVSTYAGISTIASVAGFATVASIAGFSTQAAVAGFATVATQAGISTSVIGGVADVNVLRVAGVSTFTSGPVLIGSASSTGTASQRLQVTGGAYVSGNLGIGTTNPSSRVSVLSPSNGNWETRLSGSEIIISNNSTSATDVFSPAFVFKQNYPYSSFSLGYELGAIIYSDNSSSRKASVGFFKDGNAAGIYLSPTGFGGLLSGAGDSGLTIRGSGNIGIGTTNPTSRLDVVGDAKVSGAVTATGGFNIGIQSSGLNITVGVITALNFIGAGNTFLLRGTTVDISIAGGGGGGGSNLSISTSLAPEYQYLSFVSSASTSILGISTISNPIVFTPSSGNLGLGTTSNTSKLTVAGDALISGVTTSTGGFVGQLIGVANYAYSSGFSTYSGTAGFSTISAVAGFATVATIAGVATFATLAGSAGFSTFSSTAGFATVSTQAGISSYSLFANLAGAAGFSTFSSTAGFSTFASISGFSTVAAVAGFSSVSTMAGFSTIASVAGFSTFASVSGFSTFASTSGFSTVSTISGIATSVIGGVASVNSLQVTGISTFSFGPVYIGAGQTVGITSAVVQIAGINSSMYVGGKVGIGTTNFTYALNVNGDINTSGVIRVNGRNILDDAVIFAIALG